MSKHKYHENYSLPDQVKCAVYRSKIPIPIEEIEEELKESTRIDKKLPGETSHFKHIHVTYYFCSNDCKTAFMLERDKSLNSNLDEFGF